MANEKTRGSDRTRNWAAVIYPESAPENWREILDEEHIEWIESPLHEFDVNPGTGETKKAHWHILLAFDGVKSYEQVCEILKPLNCPIPKRVQSMRGAVRYMAHLDNPEKWQYNPAEIVGHGGIDVQAFLARSETERKEIVSCIFGWIRQNGCSEFSDLMEYAFENEPEWFDVLISGYTIVFEAYFRSVRGKIRNP